MLEIAAAKAVVCCPGRNFVTLKIETKDGITYDAAACIAGVTSGRLTPSDRGYSIVPITGRDSTGQPMGGAGVRISFR